MIIRNILSDLDKNDIYNLWVKYLNKVPDHQTIGAPSARQAEFLKEYLTKVKKILELKTGYKLSERFTIIREYKKGDFMKKHIDNAAPFAVTIVIKQSDSKDNPLVFYNTEPETIILKEGDGYCFWGMEVPHERLAVQSDYLLHVYFGYSVADKLISISGKYNKQIL
tara:strand:+ start:2225 stop:2725 length:501 start_codon:yes stop_codon:yes gene_type:complete